MSTDLYPFTAAPLQHAGPSNTEASLKIYIQLIVFFILSIVSILYFTSDSKEQEDSMEALKRKISDLEDQLEILSETTKRRFASLAAEDLLETRIVSCESKLTQTISESIQAVKKEIEVSVIQRIAEIEKKIPRPSKTVSVPLEEMQFYFGWPGSEDNNSRHHMGPYYWSKLNNPWVEITYAIVPFETPVTTPIPPEMLHKERITTPRLVRTLAPGQKILVSKADMWHHTPGIPNMTDCTAQMKKWLEV